MPNAVERRERRVFHLLHGQALRRISEVGALGVEQAVVIAPAKFEGDFARDRARHPALCRLAQHDGLRVKPTALVEQTAELEAIDAVLLNRVLVVNARDQALIRNM